MTEKLCKTCYASFVPRNKNCDHCTVCKKPNKCEHGTTKGRCKIDGCFGNEICEHKQHKQKCSICKPGVKELDKLNSIMRKIIHKIAPHIQKPTHELTNHFTKLQTHTKDFIIKLFAVETFTEVIEICKKKIIAYEEHYKHPLDINYYQIDHIKPKSKFDFSIPQEFAKCCHHTNLQIVDKHENLHKNNKWSENDEIFWNENIIFKTSLNV
jgi:hypothetical protein